ncbi:hypothetical protein K505DRAFT_341478 [Melanomma pulvis-pyrius CBS 109.77]|uniref:Uncharacterized protein n=1 Tax=Melanomma pulvis-pyrius CBS 109.77 TaxID=1314802 RepID=A0A6A6WZ27_9PLEO|nr:hypothetical protein K505DRAFT_341478 [Melanomma pulvis-pyrius CBS 109.77]
MRISHAPQLRISSDAPWVVSLAHAATDSSQQPTGEVSNRAVSQYPLASHIFDETNITGRLGKGFNTTGGVIIDPNSPWTASKDPFYVIISLEGVMGGHTAFRLFLRLISKLISVAVFSPSTAPFASSSLITLVVAVLVMTLILGAGVLGRMAAMWISVVLMGDRPVLHRIVKHEKDASAFIEAVLRKDEIVCEVLGHVVINGRCVKRRSKLQWSAVFGVLAPSFDVRKIAVKTP